MRAGEEGERWWERSDEEGIGKLKDVDMRNVNGM
jgi:hypothetical protein